MLSNPQDKPILSDRTQTVDRLKIEAKFAQILPRELLRVSINPSAKLVVNDREIVAKLETQVKVAIAKTVADNCWGLWLAGMSHGRNHAMRELKMVGYGTAKFALVNDKPPSRIQNKQAALRVVLL